MSKTKKLVPKRRFKNSLRENEWQLIRLGDQAVIKGRLGWKSLKQEEYVDNGPSMIAGKHITNGVINWYNVDHIPQWRYDESPEIMLRNGDIIFSKDGSLGNPALIEKLNCLATINSTMMLVRLKKSITPRFFYQIMLSNQFENLIRLKVSGSSIPHLFQADMTNFKFCAPKLTEQTQIGEFFKKLDTLIQTQQKKLEKTKTLKAAYLAEMFPCDGELKPHYRFQCFNEVWTKNLFYNLANIRRGLTYNPSHLNLTNDGIRILRSSNIDEDRFIIKNDDIFINQKNVNIPVVSENDILITAANGSSRLVGKHALISLPKSQKAVHGGFMLLATSKQPFFTNALLSSNWYRKFLNVYIAGGNGAIGNLNKKTIENQLIKIPSTKEQTKIGNFFKLLDKKIALEQRKLEKLNNIKQAYLNEMFV